MSNLPDSQVGNASSALYETAKTYEGVWEWSEGHNPDVLAFFAASGHPEIKDDETPWCAAFVGAVLGEIGLPNTGSLLARSYEDYGTEVSIADAIQGDIVVLQRGSSSWQGHVGFFHKLEGSKVYLLGGNQRDQVNISAYSKIKILSVRRVLVEAPKPKRKSTQSTELRASAIGAVATGGTVATAVSGLHGNTQLIVAGAGVVILLAFLWIARKRIARGLRDGW